MRLTRFVAGAASVGLLGLVPLTVGAGAAHGADHSTVTTLKAYRNLLEFNGYSPGLVASVKRSDGTSVYAGTVNLHAKVAGGKWKKIRSANAGGYVSFSDVKPKKNTQYRLVYNGGSSYDDTYLPSRSKNLRVRVARKVTVKRTNNRRAYVYKGRVTPNFGKKKIVIQVSKREKKGFKRFKAVKTNKKGFYTLRLPIRKGTWYWRLKVPGNKNYAANSSWTIKTW